MNKTLRLFFFSAFFFSAPVDARMFDSTLKLKVYARGSQGAADRVLGFTPAHRGRPVRVPNEGIWYVRPSGSLNASHLERLVRLVKEERVPGLDLSDHWELTNESLSHLRSLPGLAMLDISRTKITDAGLASLQSCRALEALLLPETITDQGLKPLSSLRGLRELNLDQTRITDQGLETISGLSRLWNLDLSSTHTSDAGLAFLAKLPRLRRLVLGPAITDGAAPSLRALKGLREIDISQTQMGEKGLAALAALPSLRTVFLGRQANDAGMQALSASPSLQALDLTRAAVTDDGVKSLSRVKTLEELALSQTAIGNKSLEFLAELPELRMLELSDTRVTSRGLAPLARLKKLDVLSLSWQKLTREDLQDMAKLKQLKTIVLNGVPLPEATMAQLKRLGSPSPWDSIAGLERARFRETARTTDQMELSAPVPTPSFASTAGMRPALPTPTFAPPRGSTALSMNPLSPDQARAGGSKLAAKASRSLRGAAPRESSARVESPSVTAFSKPAPISVPASSRETPRSPFKVASLKDMSHGPRWDSEPVGSHPETSVEESAKPTAQAAPAASKKEEDNLLKAIQLQSNPARSGGFSGLSSMRQLRHTDTLASLNTVMPAAAEAAIPQEEDKPENFVGEISVGAKRGH